MKTSELTGAALDWAVAKAEGEAESAVIRGYVTGKGKPAGRYTPSIDWSQGGPIIEREGIAIRKMRDGGWIATDSSVYGWLQPSSPTPLIAAMRCYVASKLGEEVEIPLELKGE